MAKTGKHSFRLENAPRIISSASFVGDKEGKGPMGQYFDTVCKDDTLGLKSWERAESRMFESAVRLALAKISKTPDELCCLLGGDLLNQIISAGFAARELHSPFLGLYGACSTISESLLIGSMLVDGGYSNLTACAASSHFSSVERQFRTPLEMGTEATPTAQRTVTGAGCVLLDSAEKGNGGNGAEWVFKHIALAGGTIGKVSDFGITDANNMGAAMAPAAAETICDHFNDFKTSPDDYDRIITGDLGVFGSDMLYELCQKRGYGIREKHIDCGKLMFEGDKTVSCGASGCGCAATLLAGFFLPKIETGTYKKILFLATGALLSPVSSLQGESIPGIAHAIVIERV